MENEKKCQKVLNEYICQLKADHSGKHRGGGVSWTDAGAARIQIQNKKGDV